MKSGQPDLLKLSTETGRDEKAEVECVRWIVRCWGAASTVRNINDEQAQNVVEMVENAGLNAFLDLEVEGGPFAWNQEDMRSMAFDSESVLRLVL